MEPRELKEGRKKGKEEEEGRRNSGEKEVHHVQLSKTRFLHTGEKGEKREKKTKKKIEKMPKFLSVSESFR